MSDWELTSDRWPSRVYAERRLGSDPPLPDVIRRIATLLPEHVSTGPFDWEVEARRPQQHLLAERDVETLLSRTGDGCPLMVADHPTRPTAVLSVGRSPSQGIEYLAVSLPGPRQAQLADLVGMMRLVTAIAHTASAHIAHTDDSALAQAYAGRRAEATSLDRLPAALRELVSPQPVPSQATLPQLLLRTDVPASLIPAEVQWINWWNASMVDELGRDRVLTADWEAIAEHHDGSVTLAVTREPPDLTSPEDIEQLARIIDHLDLVEVQHYAARRH